MSPLMFVVIYLVVSTFYLIPSMVAVGRRHVNAMSISLTNLYLGWTVIGWFIALIWAFSNTPAASATTVVASGSSAVGSRRILKYVLGGAGFVAVLILFFVMFSPAPQVAEKGMPGVKTGTPVPAEELFGN